MYVVCTVCMCSYGSMDFIYKLMLINLKYNEELKFINCFFKKK